MGRPGRAGGSPRHDIKTKVTRICRYPQATAAAPGNVLRHYVDVTAMPIAAGNLASSQDSLSDHEERPAGLRHFPPLRRNAWGPKETVSHAHWHGCLGIYSRDAHDSILACRFDEAPFRSVEVLGISRRRNTGRATVVSWRELRPPGNLRGCRLAPSESSSVLPVCNERLRRNIFGEKVGWATPALSDVTFDSRLCHIHAMHLLAHALPELGGSVGVIASGASAAEDIGNLPRRTLTREWNRQARPPATTSTTPFFAPR